MTVSDLLNALSTITRVDLVVGDNTYRVESNEVAILDSGTKALNIGTISLAVDGRTPYIVATTETA